MRGTPPIVLSDDARKHAVGSLRRYFQAELDQEIGELKATFLLDYLLAELGPAVYNAAIADAQAFFTERTADLGAVLHREEFTYWPSGSRRRP
jgi:uncharacterized protein (DUF2164 family)